MSKKATAKQTLETFQIDDIPYSGGASNALITRCINTALKCDIGQSFFISTRELDGSRPATLVNSTRYRMNKDKRCKGMYIKSNMIKGAGKNPEIIGVRIYRVS